LIENRDASAILPPPLIPMFQPRPRSNRPGLLTSSAPAARAASPVAGLHRKTLLKACIVAFLAAATYLRAQTPETHAGFEDQMARGERAAAQGELFAARTAWTMAAEMAGISAEQKSRALIRIATTHTAQSDDFTAAQFAEEALQLGAVSIQTQIEAWGLVATAYAQYGNAAGWQKVRDACGNLLAVPDLEENTRLRALHLSVSAHLALRAYPQAAFAQYALASSRALPGREQETYRLGLARTLITQGAYNAAREILERASIGVAGLPSSYGFSPGPEDLRAEHQLLWALTFYGQNDALRARLELAEVLRVPGQTATSKPAREALLRLHLHHWLPQKDPVLKVLFIGSSHTLVGDVPALVEQIAASAPVGSVRILAGEQARMGTGMRAHWNDGEAPDTARGKIAAEPWDAVVIESFYRMNREDLAQYGGWYAEVIRKRGARPVIYETPPAKAIPYPDAYEAFHQSNLWLGKMLQAPVAPSVKAWMGVFGPNPSEEKLQELYSDWIHASPRGAYLTACCIYATLTGQSPLGLWAPEGLLSPEQREFYQNAAWKASRETQAQIGP
jgi:hypothetical protein